MKRLTVTSLAKREQLLVDIPAFSYCFGFKKIPECWYLTKTNTVRLPKKPEKPNKNPFSFNKFYILIHFNSASTACVFPLKE